MISMISCGVQSTGPSRQPYPVNVVPRSAQDAPTTEHLAPIASRYRSHRQPVRHCRTNEGPQLCDSHHVRIARFDAVVFCFKIWVLSEMSRADLIHVAPRLAELGVRDMQTFKAITPEQTVDVARNFPDLKRSCVTCSIGLFLVGPHCVTTKDDRIFPQSTPPAVAPWLEPSRRLSRNFEQSLFSESGPGPVCQQHTGHPGLTLGTLASASTKMAATTATAHNRVG